ncbi:MAG: RNA-guided pseudouridylation complex pseudouridine synthase subunit Cbf5 [Candidatus Methanofastidiosia archaeon]
MSNILEISTAETTSQFGNRPEQLSIDRLLHSGILVVDKVQGPSSHEVVAWIKNILHIDKAGHSGTLDPNVTGLLPVALEEGTKILKSLLDTGKEYVCLMRLHNDISEDDILSAMSLFKGKIYQRPPVKSAVKRRVRVREIYSLDVLDIEKRFVLFKVNCEAGTYIRKLVYDIGMVLGCGANMAELRRTRVGPFTEDDIVTLQDIADAYYYLTTEGDEGPLRKILFPIERSVSNLPRVWVRDSAIDAICHGASLALPGVTKVEKSIKKGDKVAVLSLKEELVAIGISLKDATTLKKMNKGFVVKTNRVFMHPGTYPSQWKGSN